VLLGIAIGRCSNTNDEAAPPRQPTAALAQLVVTL